MLFYEVGNDGGCLFYEVGNDGGCLFLYLETVVGLETLETVEGLKAAVGVVDDTWRDTPAREDNEMCFFVIPRKQLTPFLQGVNNQRSLYIPIPVR